MTSKTSPSSNCRPIMADYANYFEVGHNAFEFLIDFGQIDPVSGEFNIASRIAVGPTHAKLLARLLDEAVIQHESLHEPIAEIRDNDLLASALESSRELERRALDVRADKSKFSRRK